MSIDKFALPLAILMLGAAAASAQSTVELDDLDAERVGPTQIKIEFEYDGSACEAVGTAQLGETVDGTLSVTFPTESTAEMCTQQIVEIEVEQTVEADDGVTRVEVTLLAPDGTVRAVETTDVDDD